MGWSRNDWCGYEMSNRWVRNDLKWAVMKWLCYEMSSLHQNLTTGTSEVINIMWIGASSLYLWMAFWSLKKILFKENLCFKKLNSSWYCWSSFEVLRVVGEWFEEYGRLLSKRSCDLDLSLRLLIFVIWQLQVMFFKCLYQLFSFFIYFLLVIERYNTDVWSFVS